MDAMQHLNYGPGTDQELVLLMATSEEYTQNLFSIRMRATARNDDGNGKHTYPGASDYSPNIR
jgi:hypothetical protein